MLHAPVYLCPDTGVLNVIFHLIHNALHKFFALRLAQSDLFHQIVVNIRLQIFQRKIVQLHLDLGNTETLCDRRVNIHRLARFFLLLLRAHVF